MWIDNSILSVLINKRTTKCFEILPIKFLKKGSHKILNIRINICAGMTIMLEGWTVGLLYIQNWKALILTNQQTFGELNGINYINS